jgi:hypothetical protein
MCTRYTYEYFSVSLTEFTIDNKRLTSKEAKRSSIMGDRRHFTGNSLPNHLEKRKLKDQPDIPLKKVYISRSPSEISGRLPTEKLGIAGQIAEMSYEVMEKNTRTRDSLLPTQKDEDTEAIKRIMKRLVAEEPELLSSDNLSTSTSSTDYSQRETELTRIITQLRKNLNEKIKNIDLTKLTAVEEAITKSANELISKTNKKESLKLYEENFRGIEPRNINKFDDRNNQLQTKLDDKKLSMYSIQVLKDGLSNDETNQEKLFYHFYWIYKRTCESHSKALQTLHEECKQIIGRSVMAIDPHPFCWSPVRGDPVSPPTANSGPKITRGKLITYMFLELESRLKNEGISFYDDQPVSHPYHLILNKPVFNNLDDALSSHLESLTLSARPMSELTHLSQLAPSNTYTLDQINHHLNQIRKVLTHPILEVSAYIQALKLPKSEQREHIQKQKLSRKEPHIFRQAQKRSYHIEKEQQKDQRQLTQEQYEATSRLTGKFADAQQFLNPEERKKYLTSEAKQKIEEIEQGLSKHIDTLTKKTQELADIEIRKNLFRESEQTARDEMVRSYHTLVFMTENLATHANALVPRAQEACKKFQQSEYKDLQNLLKAFPEKAQALTKIIHEHYVKRGNKRISNSIQRKPFMEPDPQTEPQETSQFLLPPQVQDTLQQLYQKSRPERAQDLLQQLGEHKPEDIPGWTEKVQKLYEEGWTLTGTSRLQLQIDAFLEWDTGEARRLAYQTQELVHETQRRAAYADCIQQTFPDHNGVEQVLADTERKMKEISEKIKEIYYSIKNDHQYLKGLYEQRKELYSKGSTISEISRNSVEDYIKSKSIDSYNQLYNKEKNVEKIEKENNVTLIKECANIIKEVAETISSYASEELDID